MPRPNRFAVGDALSARLGSSFAPALLGAVSVGWLASGAACLWLRGQDAAAGPVLAPAGMVLALCGLVQLRLLVLAWHTGRLTPRGIPFSQLRFWRLFLAGTVVAYVAALALGSGRQVAWGWIAVVCLWQTLLFLPLAASDHTLEQWRRWTQGHTARRLAWLVYASILIMIVAELSLQARRLAAHGLGLSIDRAWAAADRGAATGPHGVITYAEPERFRVAVLGNGLVSNEASRGYLARVERTLPGLEIVRFDGGHTTAAAGDVAGQLFQHQPDLLLAMLPVCEDLVREPVERGYFDWRRYELALLLAGPADAGAPVRSREPAENFESYLSGLRPQLAACRTPIDERMRDRWAEVYASLDRLVADCGEAGVPVALVIVPAEFQVNRALRDTLLRRNGLSAEAFDVELPQRRLARFAEHRGLPMIDLLPHLRLCRQSVYRRHTTALSEAGHSAAANAIGGWLESRYGAQMAAQLSAAP